MLIVNVKVPAARDRAAAVEFRSGKARLATGLAAASASTEIAARHGNAACDPLRPWGHPPLGAYQLLARGPAPAGSEAEYGTQVLVFQPMTGSALEAESFGRLHLLAYAGPAGKGGLLRPTQGGLRFEQARFSELLDELNRDSSLMLEIEPLRPPAWWQIWKSATPTPPLAQEAPRFSAAPLDESSIAVLIAAGKRFSRRSRLEQEDDLDSKDITFTPDSGRATDSSGRIAAGAAGAAIGTRTVASTQVNTSY